MNGGWCDDSRAQRMRRQVFVGGLHVNASVGDVVRHVVAACGRRPQDVFLQRGRSGASAGFAYVELASVEDAAAVVGAGLPPLAGRPLVVAWRRPPRPRS